VAEEDEETAQQAQIDDAPVVKLINGILTEAVRPGASDIHIEPFEHELRVRYRIDGALLEVMKPPIKLKAALTSRVKILSQLNIASAVCRRTGGSSSRWRTGSSTPRLDAAGAVRREDRAAHPGQGEPDARPDQVRVRAEGGGGPDEGHPQPYGMVLVTGPTGSGKTTTLYSCLHRINTIETNIMTAEDPSSYNLMGINQVLVRSEIGLTFAAALKAFLRQDPNIIMIGEIRDLETGGIAIKAALTGHLVLSTLHTNDAPSTITRLIDMGLEAFNVASAVNLVVAQRLVRRICKHCAEPTTYPEVVLKSLSMDLGAIEHFRFMKGKGCDSCGGLGYKGRAGLYEVMALSPAVRKAILRGDSAAELRDIAVAEGMLTLRMDGLKKIERGITTLDEVVKETAA